MKFKQHFGLSGKFTNFEVLNKSGEVVRKCEPFSNLITDGGLDRMYMGDSPTNPRLYDVCKVGTGNTPESPYDNDLEAQVASVSPWGSSNGAYSSGVNLEENYFWGRFVYIFSLGAIQNKNISEVSTGWSTGVGIFSRALIRDALGNPTSITVLEDEQLRVTWEHRRYFDPSPKSGSIVNVGNKGGTINYTIYPANINNWSLWTTTQNYNYVFRSGGVWYLSLSPSSPNKAFANAVFNYPNGTVTGTAINPSQVVDVTEGKRKFTTRYRFPIGNGNHANGLSGLFWSFSGSNSTHQASSQRVEYQVEFNPPIMKTNEDFLEIDFEISWGRYEPEPA